MGELIRGYCRYNQEWVYGESIPVSGDGFGHNLLSDDGVKYSVYEDSIGRRSPWRQEGRGYVYEGDHVVMIHDVTESTREVWGAHGEVMRFGVVVVVDGEFDIELSNGSLLDVSFLESELSDLGTRIMMTVDRNEYELSQSYYMVTVSGYVFGHRGGVEFEEHMDPVTFKFDRDTWGTESVYRVLAKGLNELGAEVPDVERYRLLSMSAATFTMRDEMCGDDALYYSVSLDVSHMGYTYVFERFQPNSYMLLDGLEIEDYVKNRLAKY